MKNASPQSVKLDNDLLENFKNEQLKRKAENTAMAYLSDLNKYKEYMSEYYHVKKEELETKHITNESISLYKDHVMNLTNPRTKEKYSTKTVNRHLISIKIFIKYLEKNNLMDKTNDIEIVLLKVQKTYYIEDLLERNEFLRMLTKANEHNDSRAVIIFETLYYTGARVSEMLQLTPRQIVDDNLTIKGKGNKYRELILADDIQIKLAKYIKNNNIADHQLIFPISRQTVHKIIKKYAGKCKIKLKHASAHKFRHLHAIDLLDNGATLEEVADDLGHSDINVTRVYTKKTKEELRKTINRLSIYK